MVLFSKSFIFTLKENPKIAECRSHQFLLRGCFISIVSSGIYSYLPLGRRVLRKISNIIRKHMNSQGAEELSLSYLQPIEMWEKTGRDKDLGEVMFRFKDRKMREFVLGPTHEEEITEIVGKFVSSYKQLPLILYQIQTKFRDEPRPRYGLMRGCEFIMKDAYSFDIDEEGLNESYQKMRFSYGEIFKECGLDFVVVEADPGFMGGDISHEFMVPVQIGEDVLFYCKNCVRYFREEGSCLLCKKNLKKTRMMEVGHIFKLGTKYSLTQGAFFLDQKGRKKSIIMGCYGIGVSRILAAIVETNCDEKGIIWPKAVSPFDVSLLILEEELLSEGLSLGNTLEKEGFSILVDERKKEAGIKFNDALLLGNPYILIMGKNYLESKRVDVEIRKTREKLSLGRDELIKFLKNECNK